MISDFPLFVFTLFGGMSIGLLAADAIFSIEKRQRPWVLPFAALALMGIGLIGCLFHLGHPEGFMTALANPTAGIAQEAYASIVYCVLLLVELALAWFKKTVARPLVIATAIVGVVLAVIMGLTYQSFLGIEAWLSVFTLPLFLLGDLFLGCALYCLFATDVFKSKGFAVYFWVLAALCAITFVGLAVQFMGLGLNGALFIVGLAIGPLAGSVTTILARKGAGANYATVTCVLVVLGVALARWGFYSANVF